MRITYAAVVSDARGKSGDVVFTENRRSASVRRYVKPFNTQSAARTSARNVFRALQQLYGVFGASGVAPWDAYRPLGARTQRNLWLSLNNSNLLADANWERVRTAPGDPPVPPAGWFNAVISPTSIEVQFVYPTPPAGMTLAGFGSSIWKNLAPTTSRTPLDWDYQDSTESHPSTLHLYTGLTPAQQYLLAGWVILTDSDGHTLYGESEAKRRTPN